MSKNKQNRLHIYQTEFIGWVCQVVNQYNQDVIKVAGFHSEESAVQFYREWKKVDKELDKATKV